MFTVQKETSGFGSSNIDYSVDIATSPATPDEISTISVQISGHRAKTKSGKQVNQLVPALLSFFASMARGAARIARPLFFRIWIRILSFRQTEKP